MRDLRPLLKPRSVAIVGASSRPDSVAGRPLANLQRQRFPGALYPINPQRSDIGGLPSYAGVADLPATPDLALIVAPSGQVLPALEACASRGVQAAIVLSAGFAEAGDDGAARQQRMADLAAASGMIVCGPNSIGVLNFVDFIPLSFTSSVDMDRRKTGRIAMVSQSGGLMMALSNRAFDAGVGLSYGVSTGNEADLTVTEALEWLAEEGSSDAFILVVEHIRQGRRFMAVCRRLLELGKPLVAYKIGRTGAGTAAARSHTGMLAGSYRSLQAVFRQLGVIEAGDLDDAIDLAAAAAFGRWPLGPNVGIVTGSGGAGAAAADRAEELGLLIPPFGDGSAERLRPFLPGFAPAVENPFDATAQSMENPASGGEITAILAQDPDIHAVLSIDPGSGEAGRLRGEAIAPVALSSAKPVFEVVLAGSQSSPMAATLRAAGVPLFRSPAKAIEALAGLRRFGLAAAALARRPMAGQAPPAHPLSTRHPALGTPLGEYEAKRFLAQFGIPVVEERLACSAEEAVAAAGELGFPVAVKVHAPGIVHKSDIGGVRLGLPDAAAVREAYAAMPGGEVLVARMADVRLELIAGFHADPTFGPLVLLGLGGIWAEALEDVALRPAPLAAEDVPDMAAELHGAALLRGARGLPPVDTEALRRIMLAVSDVATSGQLRGLDINPLAVQSDGSLVALDASLFME